MPRFYRYAKGEATKVNEARAGTSGLTHVALDVSENPQKMTSVDVSPTNIQLPQVPVINSARPRPGEVTQAILFTLSIDPEGLRERDVFKLARPLVVFSRLEVRTVKIHGDLGQAQVRMTVPLCLAGDGQPSLKRRQETQMWPLRRRDQKSWELLLPHDVIYMPRDTAVRILAHQLMLLADTESSTASLPQKSQLAQMLKTILVE